MDELLNYGALGIITIVGIKLYWDSLRRQDRKDKEHKEEIQKLTEEFQRSVTRFTTVMQESIRNESKQTDLMKDIKGMVIKVLEKLT